MRLLLFAPVLCLFGCGTMQRIWEDPLTQDVLRTVVQEGVNIGSEALKQELTDKFGTDFASLESRVRGEGLVIRRQIDAIPRTDPGDNTQKLAGPRTKGPTSGSTPGQAIGLLGILAGLAGRFLDGKA